MLGRMRTLATVAGVLALALAGCGSTTSGGGAASSGGSTAAKNLPTFTSENFEQLEQTANDNKGARVEGIVGKVFNVDRSGENAIALQMWLDDDANHQAIVLIEDPTF